jgi:hypothetical protein
MSKLIVRRSLRMSSLLFVRPALVPFLAALIAPLLASCGFHPFYGPITCPEFESIPLAPLTAQSSQIVFEDVGTIIAIHGTGSANFDSGHAGALKVEQSMTIPSYANQATVFLNGWRANYPGGDHNVLALSTLIGKIRTNFEPSTKTNRLTWDAVGLLTDDSLKEGFNWTYEYTMIAWNAANINAVVDQGGDGTNQYCSPQPEQSYIDNYFYSSNINTNTALSCFFSFIQNNAFASNKTVAVLPRGFGFVWSDGDHHMRQVAYNLDHSEIFAENKRQYNKQASLVTATLPGTASEVGSGFVSWNPYVIFKDDDTRRDYMFAELVSGMGGRDVGVMQPPFSILPTDDGDSFFNPCTTVSSPGVRSEDFVIENVPFEYAIPMLSGWDLEYLCSDQHVKEIGIWIDQWSYQPPPLGASGGTLRYKLSSVLRDDDNNPDYFTGHKVTVLGLRPVVGGKGVLPVVPPLPVKKPS